jgi:RNA polymerase sigma-70 factor (ECF subfamily)
VNRRTLIALKIAEFAPIPTASVTTASHVNPGVRAKDLIANRSSRVNVSNARIPRCSQNSSFICSRPPKLRRAASALAAWTQARSFRGHGACFWLFSIAWRKAKGSHRRWFRAARRDTAYHEFFSNNEAQEAASEDRIALRQALLSLALDQRAAVVLCLGSVYSHAEAAEMLAVPLGTVKSYVLRGREKLRGILRDR